MATAREDGEPQFSYSLGSEDLCDLVCQPCQLDGQLHEAVGLCTDCQEYLCQKCYDGHTLPTPSRNHKLLNKKQMLDGQISLERKDECSEKCPVHVDKTIKYYCINHCHLGCSVCITLDHRSCDNVRYIPHVANDLANNEEYTQAERQLDSVVERSKSVTDDCQQKIDALEQDCSEALKTVQELKREINEVLDKIEDDLVKSCETLKSEEMKKITQIVDNIKTAQKEVNALLAMKERYENNKQKCNLYTVMMKTKDQLKAAESRIHEAEKGQSSINSHIRFVGNKETLTTMKKPETFGQLLKTEISTVLTSEKTRTTDIQEKLIPAIIPAEPSPAVMREKPIPAVMQKKSGAINVQAEAIPAVMQKKSGTINVQAEAIPAVMQKKSGAINVQAEAIPAVMQKKSGAINVQAEAISAVMQKKSGAINVQAEAIPAVMQKKSGAINVQAEAISAVMQKKSGTINVQAEAIPAVMQKKSGAINVQAEAIPAVMQKKSGAINVQAEAISAVMQKKSGTINVQAEQIRAVMKEERETIARVEHVQDVKVKSRSDKNTCIITGLVVLPDKRLLITDCNDLSGNGLLVTDCYHGILSGNGNIKLVDVQYGQVITHLTLPTAPWGVALITNSQVAVTMPDSKKVAIVNVIQGIVAFINVTATAMTVDRTLDMNGQCHGVDYRDGKMAVSFVDPDKVQVLTLQGRVLYTITKSKGRDLFNKPFYVAFGHDNTSLYVSNYLSNTVVHVKFDGTVVGTYTDRELILPRALLTDSSGSVYVCGQISNNIHQLTVDCRKVQVLLTGKDGLFEPCSIGYSEAEGRLYVGMGISDVVKMYSVVLGSK